LPQIFEHYLRFTASHCSLARRIPSSGLDLVPLGYSRSRSKSAPFEELGANVPMLEGEKQRSAICCAAAPEQRAMLTATRKLLSGNEDRNDPVNR
jgi:hypothetical protein